MTTERPVSLVLVHHANQYLITNGYPNREGIDSLVGSPQSGTGYLRILELHRAFQIPLSLHLSGTLLEALVWYRPDVLEALRALGHQGLLEVIGSCYGQNIMRFFTYEHNLRQLTELLELYQEHLHLDPRHVTVFWPPERVWDTARVAPVLTDSRLPNGGYRSVLLDDRLLFPLGPGLLGREAYDRTREPRLEAFVPCRIQHGQGLVALPIARSLRANIPPRDARGLQEIEHLLRWLAAAGRQPEGEPIAIYGDDLEKAAGTGPWSADGPAHYEAFLRWLSQHPWVRTVKLGERVSSAPPAAARLIDVGTFAEMSTSFGAGEGYEKWYFEPRWDRYRSYSTWSEDRVKTLTALGADPTLIELAWKHLLASSWETAWHVPPCGVHGDGTSHGHPSPWSQALASHSRHAAVIAEAAHWMRHRDDHAHVQTADIDHDGSDELILKNDKLFAVVSPRCGGRLVYLFSLEGPHGKLVIGNPSDDWNWLEDLNEYMHAPANHPGAVTDVGYEGESYEVALSVPGGGEASATLSRRPAGLPGAGIQKTFSLAYGSDELRVSYQLPDHLSALAIECGFSPDYLDLLRRGRRSLARVTEPGIWGWRNNGVTAWLRLDGAGSVVVDEAAARDFGHGQAIRLTANGPAFTMWLGARQTAGRARERRAPARRSATTRKDHREPLTTPARPGRPIERLSRTSISRATALGILTAPDIMAEFFQTQLPRMGAHHLIVKECRPKLLKNRLGSRQVIGYTLVCTDGETGAVTPLELVGKRYADGAEGERVFRAMRSLWGAGFGEGNRSNIPEPLGYFPGPRLLIQRMARGVLLADDLGWADPTAAARMPMIARWLVKLHQLDGVPEVTVSYEGDAAAIHRFAAELAARHPQVAATATALASSLARQLAASGPATLAPVHGDFHPENIFVTSGGVTVIDFDTLRHADPASDLGYLVGQMRLTAYRTTGSVAACDAAVRAFLRAYLAHLPPPERQAVASRLPLFAARTLLEALYYIFSVLGEERPLLLGAVLGDIEWLIGSGDWQALDEEGSRPQPPLVSVA
jgi:hypothetical protein